MEQNLKVGNWYFLEKENVSWLMFFTGDLELCYGWNTSIDWGNNYSMNPFDNWRFATPEKLTRYFTHEAVGRDLINGVQILDCDNNLIVCSSDCKYKLDGNVLYLGDAVIFKNGVWAEKFDSSELKIGQEVKFNGFILKVEKEDKKWYKIKNLNSKIDYPYNFTKMSESQLNIIDEDLEIEQIIDEVFISLLEKNSK